MKKNNQSGFSVLALLITIFIMILIVGVFVLVWLHYHHQSSIKPLSEPINQTLKNHGLSPNQAENNINSLN